jgi:Subtilase family
MWKHLEPTAPYSRLNWADPAASPRFDPRLDWAELVNLAGRDVGPDDPVPVALEIQGGGPLLEQLHKDGLLIVPLLYRRAGTALCHATAFARVADLHKLPPSVLRVEMGWVIRTARPHTGSGEAWFSGAVRQLQQQEHAAARALRTSAAPRHVIAVIDDGCAFANTQFRGADGTRSRVMRLWDQGRTAASDTPDGARALAAGWKVPDGMGYGMELDADAIATLMDKATGPDGRLQERACYQRADIAMPAPESGGYLHGTHVMDLAAGRIDPMARDAEPDAAAAAELIFVQLPRVCFADRSGSWLATQVLDALRYVMDHTDPQDRVVVNLSLGAQAGPHDGSSLLEAAIDDLIERERKTNLAVVVAAGNSYDQKGHARVAVAPSHSGRFIWTVAPGDATDSFLELWWPADADAADKVSVEVQSPKARASSGPIAAGGRCAFTASDQHGPSALVSHLHRTIAGKDRAHCQLALAPTRQAAGYPGHAPAGDWVVTLHNHGTAPITVDAWIERDGVNEADWNENSGVWIGKQSTFKKAQVTKCTLASLACGRHTVVVGAAVRGQAPPEASPFSSAGPALGKSARSGPDISAPGSEARGGRGIRAASGFSGQETARSGTSMAAPIAARRLLNAMAASALPLTSQAALAQVTGGAGGMKGKPPDLARLGATTIAL